MRAVLGDMAHQDDRGPLLLGEADQLLRRSADLADGAGGALDEIAVHRLDRIDDQQRRRLAPADRRQDIADRGSLPRAEPGLAPSPRRTALAPPARPIPRPRHKRPAGPRTGKPRRDLQKQGRLADAGVATDQHRRAGDDAAADRPSNSASPLGRRAGKSGRSSEPDQRNSPPAALEIVLRGKNVRDFSGFLDERIPLGAVGALPLPAAAPPSRRPGTRIALWFSPLNDANRSPSVLLEPRKARTSAAGQTSARHARSARRHGPRLSSQFPFVSVGLLLTVACLIAMILAALRPALQRRPGRRRLPNFARFPNSPDLPLSRELIFNIFLPPLVFEAALQLDWKRFRAELPLTITLAFFGVGIAAAVVAGGMHWLAGWSWIGAALFESSIAATDPVSVIAAFREMGCAAAGVDGGRIRKPLERRRRRGRLRGSCRRSPPALRLAPAASCRRSCGRSAAELPSALESVRAILLIVGRTDDPLVEITLTTIAAYASFLLAEQVHASGIISALTAGLQIGNIGWDAVISDAGKPAGALGVGVFRLSRQQLRVHPDRRECRQPAASPARLGGGIDRHRPGARRARTVGLSGRFAVQLVALAAAARGTSTYCSGAGCAARLHWRWRWRCRRSVPERNAIILTAFVVVAFSILVQGLTMPWLMRRLGLGGRGANGDADADAEVAGQQS